MISLKHFAHESTGAYAIEPVHPLCTQAERRNASGRRHRTKCRAPASFVVRQWKAVSTMLMSCSRAVCQHNRHPRCNLLRWWYW
eukprot:459815-Pelagomonas_calceolata.AAC.3